MDKVYIETSIVSHAAAWSSRDVATAGLQQQARDWWANERHKFELVTSQLTLDEAADEAAKYQREQSRAGMATALDNIKKGGMQVTELSPAELAKFREKVKPVIAKHSATVGEATVAEVMAELDKLRK